MIDAQLKDTVQNLTANTELWVGFSGGLDSHVLLDCCVNGFRDLKAYRVHALHIHHGLSIHADEWVKHCEQICQDYHIPLTTVTVNAKPDFKQSPEEAARVARLKAFNEKIPLKATLLLAHHEDDQAETVLFRLLRGAGPLGLGAMQPKSTLASGQEILRPFLQTSKQAIVDYARLKNLTWIEDESNVNLRFDRNFLRHKVLPLLQERWPYATRAFARSATLCREENNSNEILALQDLAVVKNDDAGLLSVRSLLKLSSSRQKSVLRLWLKQQGLQLPSYAHIERLQKEVLGAGWDKSPRLKISHYEIWRKQDKLGVRCLT